MPIALSSLDPCDIGVAVISTLSRSGVGTIIILLFIAIESMLVILSLNDQYGCSSFCSSALVMSSLRVIVLTACLSAHHLLLSIHDSIELMVMTYV